MLFYWRVNPKSISESNVYTHLSLLMETSSTLLKNVTCDATFDALWPFPDSFFAIRVGFVKKLVSSPKWPFSVEKSWPHGACRKTGAPRRNRCQQRTPRTSCGLTALDIAETVPFGTKKPVRTPRLALGGHWGTERWLRKMGMQDILPISQNSSLNLDDQPSDLFGKDALAISSDKR